MGQKKQINPITKNKSSYEIAMVEKSQTKMEIRLLEDGY
jgi:hypothetical protein